MTVKCLNEDQKIAVVAQFRILKMSIVDIAKDFNRSPRTIARVLEEAGYAPVHRRRSKEEPVVQTVNVELPKLTPFEYFKCFVKALFKKSKTNGINQ